MRLNYTSDMKNTPKLIVEFIFTVFIASVLSAILALILMFIAGNLNIYDQAIATINSVTGTVFGLILGYKLNTLVRLHKSEKK